MPHWLEEVLIVIEASPRLRAAILATLIVPPLIPLLGSTLLDRLTSIEPLAAFTAVANRSLFYLWIALALSAFITCLKSTAAEYRRAQKRLFQ